MQRGNDIGVVMAVLRYAPWLLVVGSLTMASATCTHSSPDQKMVGEPVSQKTRASIAAGEAEVSEALSSFILETDRSVCRHAEGRRAARNVRQAISEAYIEVVRAVEKSEKTARENEPGEAPTPADAESGEQQIVWMSHETAEKAPPRHNRQCRNAAAHRECVDSAANSVARLLYRSKIGGHALAPDELAILLPVLARDLRWALQKVDRSQKGPARNIIKQGCRAGESPLNDYLQRNDDNVSLDEIRGAFKGDHPGFCTGLAATYVDVISTLHGQFEQALISQRCNLDDWDAL